MGRQLSDRLGLFIKLLSHPTNHGSWFTAEAGGLRKVGHPTALQPGVCMCRGCQSMRAAQLQFDNHVSSSYGVHKKKMVWTDSDKSTAHSVFLIC